MEQYIASVHVSEFNGTAVIDTVQVISVKGTTPRIKLVPPDEFRSILCNRITWVIDLSHVGFALVKMLSKGGKVPGTIITGDGKWLKITAAGNTEIRNASAILPNESDLIKIRDVFHELGIGHSKYDPFTLSMIARKTWADSVKGLLYWVDNHCLTAETYKAARAAYRGGFTMAHPGEYGAGIALDINSLYPWIMVTKPMPVGCGKHVLRWSEKDKLYLLHVSMICKHKKGVDFIKSVIAGTYDTDEGIKIDAWITSIDWAKIWKNYDVIRYDVKDSIEFDTIPGELLFGSYIRPLYDKKVHADGAEKAAAKLLMNGLSGSFGRSNHEVTLAPYIKGNIYGEKNVNYKYIYEHKTGVPEGYMPIAAAITAYGRERIIEDIETIGMENVIYANTDSMFVEGRYTCTGSKELGQYKNEINFNRARIIGHCCYFLDGGKKVKTACPGVSKKARKGWTSADYEEFATNKSFEVYGWKVVEDGCKVPAKKAITIRQ